MKILQAGLSRQCFVKNLGFLMEFSEGRAQQQQNVLYTSTIIDRVVVEFKSHNSSSNFDQLLKDNPGN